MAPYYEYKRIDLATDAIRLLRLLKGCRGDTIQCELFESYLHLFNEEATTAPADGVKGHAPMGEPSGIPYEALSYTWGSSVSEDRVWLGISQVEVTENLYCALKNLRQADQDRILWVDALCIDQKHNAVCPCSRSLHKRRPVTDSVLQEKSHQVGQMRLIYQNAQNVIIWLGPGNFRTNQLFTQMSTLDRRAIQRPRPRTLATWKVEWEHRPMDLDEEDVPFDFEEALRDLLSHDWFERVWTIQEAAMARSARIACGQNQVHSRTFTMIPSLLNVIPTTEQQARLDIMPGLGRETSWFSRLQDTKLQTLLERFRSCKATIPHDSIYALIGICKEAHNSPRMIPDYTLNPNQVVKNTLIFLLNESDQMEGSPLDYYGEFPDWDVEELLDALYDLPYYLYTWARQRYKPQLMFAILSSEKAKGNVRNFARLVSIPGDFVIAINKYHLELMGMFLELEGGILRKRLLEDRRLGEVLKILLARHDDKRAAKLLTVNAQKQEVVVSKTGKSLAELVDCQEFDKVLASLLPRYCDAVDITVDVGRVDLLGPILDHNPELLGQGEVGHEALWKAASRGDERCTASLLEHGANVEVNHDGDGTTPLWTAASEGCLECVEILLRHGADVEAKRKDDDVTPLWIAAKRGFSECVELLLSYGADIEAKRNYDDATPLWIAASEGCPKCLKILLRYGPCRGAKDSKMGTTPLQVAANNRHMECAEILRTWL